MEIVAFKNVLNSHAMEQDIKTHLLEKINAIPNITILKLDLELTLYCCNVVENVVKKYHKIDKQKLVVDVLSSIFPLTSEEQILLCGQIDFLNSNRKIKVMNSFKYFGKKLFLWVEKKLL